MRSLWLLAVYLIFLGVGTTLPFVATLGYVWADTFRPQEVSYTLLNQLPVAMIMGAVAVGCYILTDRRSPPRLSLETVLQTAMAVWVTLTLIWAERPDEAWGKWDWAFKTLAFAAFIPFVIRTRVQIEAFAQVYVWSLAANFVPFGVKTLISGGGYGSNLGLQQGNGGLAEGGLLSTVCLMAVPLAVYLSKYSLLVPKLHLIGWGYWVIGCLAILTAVGTYERSALIGLVVLGAYMWVRSRHKFAFGLVLLVVAMGLGYVVSAAWTERVSTIGDFQHENSAWSRVLVWQWTLDYVSTHPMGGGFVAYLIDHIEVPGVDGAPGITQFGRAFHSIYFEVLGEQGFPGLAIFLVTAGSMFFKLRGIAKRARAYRELQWVVGIADALQSGLAVFMTSGAFVGIAFQPMFWYFISLGVSLNAYMWRVEHQESPRGSREWAAATAALPSGSETAARDWRKRQARTKPS